MVNYLVLRMWGGDRGGARVFLDFSFLLTQLVSKPALPALMSYPGNLLRCAAQGASGLKACVRELAGQQLGPGQLIMDAASHSHSHARLLLPHGA